MKPQDIRLDELTQLVKSGKSVDDALIEIELTQAAFNEFATRSQKKMLDDIKIAEICRSGDLKKIVRATSKTLQAVTQLQAVFDQEIHAVKEFKKAMSIYSFSFINSMQLRSTEIDSTVVDLLQLGESINLENDNDIAAFYLIKEKYTIEINGEVIFSCKAPHTFKRKANAFIRKHDLRIVV